jgi:hypothetical protein
VKNAGGRIMTDGSGKAREISLLPVGDKMRLLRLIVFIAFLAVPAYANDASMPLANFKAPAMDSAASRNDEIVPDLKTIQSRAAKGEPGAQDLVGKHYEEGDGVPQDSAKAAKLYFRAAQQGYIQAQKDLGYLYLKGDGVPQDYAQAYFWITLSLDPFDASSAAMRDDIAKYLSPEQLSEQERRLNEWKPNMEKKTSDDDSSDDGSLCTAKYVAQTMELPVHASRDCNDAYKNIHAVCGMTSCTDCEIAVNKSNLACTRVAKVTDPAFTCETNADCFLIDKWCGDTYEPVAANREHLQEVRKARGYTTKDCHRPLELKQQFHALCINSVCSVRQSQ